MRSNYIKLLNILLTAGVPVDNPDFVGKTSLHHAARDSGTGDIIKVLLKCGAKVDLQDRFGASPLLVAMQEDSADVIPLLLDGGASLDVTDGEGSSPRSTYPTRPANVSRVVKDWLVRHKGKKAVLQGDRCSKCGSSCASMKRCARCRSRLYCSPGCQSVFFVHFSVEITSTHDHSAQQKARIGENTKRIANRSIRKKIFSS